MATTVQRVEQAAMEKAAEVYTGQDEGVKGVLQELSVEASRTAVEGAEFARAVEGARSRREARAVMETKTERVQYSRRNATTSETQSLYENRDLSNDKSLYDYDFLVSLPDIQVSTEGDLATALDEDGNIDHPKLKQQSLENAAQYGEVIDDGNVIVYNTYTNRPIRISSRGLDHSTHTSSQVKNQINARASLAAGELASKALPLNAEYNKNAYALGTYAMAAPVQSVDGRITSVAVLTVEIRSGSIAKIDVYDLLHSLSVRKKNEGGLDGETPSPARLGHADRSAATRSSYSIAEFLEIVNSTHQSLLSDDVLAHFNAARNPEGYYSGRVKYSRRRATAPSFRQAMMDMAITEDMTRWWRREANGRKAGRLCRSGSRKAWRKSGRRPSRA